MFAAIRPHSIDLALIVHVAGAMVLVGALVTAAAAGIIGWRDEAGALRRLSYRTLLFVALPAWFVMWFGAIWTESREHLDNLREPAGVARHRPHRRRRRGSAAADRADPGRHRNSEIARRPGRRPDQGEQCDGDLPGGRLRHCDLGDGREAELALGLALLIARMRLPPYIH